MSWTTLGTVFFVIGIVILASQSGGGVGPAIDGRGVTPPGPTERVLSDRPKPDGEHGRQRFRLGLLGIVLIVAGVALLWIGHVTE